MLSLFAIVFSSAMVMYITLRAVKLDRVRPWFETRSIYEQELKREKAAREAAKQKATFGQRPDGLGSAGSAAARAARR
jgi:hypothetical protein